MSFLFRGRMGMAEIRIPQGMRDLIGEEVNKKRKAQEVIEKVFGSFGYQQIMTPMLEYFDTYQQAFSNTDATEMYKFFDHEGNILSLREDMTVPICRVCASKFSNSRPPFRFFYTSDVFKVRHVFAGKRGEVTDCGVECIGLDESSDVEILYMALTVLNELKFQKYQLEIGNARFFQCACDSLNLTSEEKTKLADLVDRKSIVDLTEYVETLSLKEKEKQFFLALPFLTGTDIFSQAYDICLSEEMKKEVDQLKTLYDKLKQLNMHTNISFDLGKIPHLDYYTGIIFEGYIQESGTSILSGGRYDNLMGRFGRDLPACGFSIKLDYILDALEVDPNRNIKLYYPKGKEVEALQKSNELRKNGNVEMIPWDKDTWEVQQ